MSTVLLLLITMYTSTTDMISIRERYNKAAGSESEAISLQKWIREQSSPTSVLLAYDAGLEMMMAKYAFNPFTKYQYFQTGKNKLEQLIQLHPDELEIRYIRFAIQYYSPAFLNYRDQLEGDKEYLVKRIGSLNDKDLKKRVKELLLKTDMLTSTQKNAIEKL